MPARVRPALLLLSGFLFYAAEGLYGALFLFGSVLSVYLGGLLLQKNAARRAEALSLLGKEQKAEKQALKKRYKTRRSLILWAVLGANLLVLAACKYPLFSARSLLMPLGLSFYMFTALGYLIDVKQEKVLPERNPLRLALFISFFPQLVQGPISRFRPLAPQLYAGRRPDGKDFCAGLTRVLFGYFEKLVLADRLTAAVTLLFHDAENGVSVLLGMLLYAFRLYWDFAGGIDIALGSARLLGIRMEENFRAPFLSRSLEEYWRRWHVSMGAWFRDYIFYPLNMSSPMLKWTKALRGRFSGLLTRLPLYVSLLVTWAATGLWHGAGWNFLLWGLTNGVLLILAEEHKPRRAAFLEKHPGYASGRLRPVLETAGTFLLLCLIRLWDNFSTPAETLAAFGHLFTSFRAGHLGAVLSSLALTAADGILLLSGLALTVWRDARVYREKRVSLEGVPVPVFCALVFAAVLVILLFGRYGIGYEASAFIYGRY